MIIRIPIFLLLNFNGAHLSCGGPRPKPNQSCAYDYESGSSSESSVDVDVVETLQNIATALLNGETEESELIETRNKHLVNVIRIDVSDDDDILPPNGTPIISVSKPLQENSTNDKTPCNRLLIFLTAVGILFALINLVLSILQFTQGTKRSYYYRTQSIITPEQCVE